MLKGIGRLLVFFLGFCLFVLICFVALSAVYMLVGLREELVDFCIVLLIVGV